MPARSIGSEVTASVRALDSRSRVSSGTLDRRARRKLRHSALLTGCVLPDAMIPLLLP
jgi:hypothetical protein